MVAKYYMTMVKCPYCGLENKHTVNRNHAWEFQITYCDGEAGGCGRRFVLEWDIEVSARTRKIEGEQ
jgi:peptide subunit release factor 1 (eRF1)